MYLNFKRWLYTPALIIIRADDLNEATVRHLIDSTHSFAPLTEFRQNAIDTITITNLNLTPDLQGKTLLVRSLAMNEGREYTPIIQFKGIKFIKKLKKGYFPVKVNETIYYMKLPLIDTNHVTVSCTCWDYKTCFAEANFEAGCHFGNISRAHENKGIKNPNKMIGGCKHLLALVRDIF
jgi:hypothetical protein